MAYLDDVYLLFLESLDSEDLNALVNLLILNRETKCLKQSERFKKYYPKHQMYVQDIREEIQYLGANSFVSKLRGHGVVYSEIVTDVAKRLKIDLYGSNFVPASEALILEKLLCDMMKPLSEQQRQSFAKEVGIELAPFGQKMTVELLFRVELRRPSEQACKLAAMVANSVLRTFLPERSSGVSGAFIGTAILGGPLAMLGVAAHSLFSSDNTDQRILAVVTQVAYLRKLDFVRH